MYFLRLLYRRIAALLELTAGMTFEGVEMLESLIA